MIRYRGDLVSKRSNSKATRTRHSQEFKDEALKLADQVGVSTAAEQLGLHSSQLYGWRSKARMLKSRGEVNAERVNLFCTVTRKLMDIWPAPQLPWAA